MGFLWGLGFLKTLIMEGDQAKTSYCVSSRLIVYRRIPYVLHNTPAHFQRVMDTKIALAGLEHRSVTFIDHMLVWSDSPEQHEKDVAAILDMLQACGFRIPP